MRRGERALTVEEIKAALDALVEHGFAHGWDHADRLWYVQHAYLDGPYTQRQISTWIAGARAMGAGI